MHKSAFLFFVLVVGIGPLPAQHNHLRSLGFQTDNDAYLFRFNDRYYTNGLSIRYQWRKAEGVNKIHGLELGQKIFTPLNRNTVRPADIDYPYAGYLYGRYSQLTFPDDQLFYQWNITLGLVGPAAGGEGMQKFYHQLLGYSQFKGWRYQIGNNLGLDAGGQLGYTVADAGYFKITPLLDLRAGTQFVQASAGAYFVLGAYENQAGSALLHSGLQAKEAQPERKAEAFLYWYPQVLAQQYNVIVQGGRQRRYDSAVTRKLEPYQFGHTLGFCYARNRLVAKAEWTFWSKEAVGQFLTHRYASLQLTYRFQ